jgi:hypothetical protein
VQPVDPLEQIELLALMPRPHKGAANVLDQLLRLRVLRIDVRSLKGPRQKRRAPILRTDRRQSARAKRHEPRQILILRAQAIGDP